MRPSLTGGNAVLVDAEKVAEAAGDRSPENNDPHVRGSVQPHGHGAVDYVPARHW